MTGTITPEEAMRMLTRRYSAEPKALIAVLCPLLLPIHTLDKMVFIAPGSKHRRASFTVRLNEETKGVLVRGRTGKFVPEIYGGGGAGWREIAKGRIIDVDYVTGIANGEIYVGSGKKGELDLALSQLTAQNFLEIDQFGTGAKALSGLTEYYLVENLKSQGFNVVRMPEDMAAHLGTYMNFDFLVERGGVKKRLEVKSLWGTNTTCARLIHSTTTPPKGAPETWTDRQRVNYYPTSSCKFATQDLFAVSMFLRTGNIHEFAFARSVPDDVQPYGLPRAREYPEHVGQNPLCSIGDGTWFATIDDVWNLA
jgi:hypothetical protein